MHTSDAREPSIEGSGSEWGPARRVAFRFGFAYLALYLVLHRFLEVDLAVQNEFGFAPGAGLLLAAYARLWAPVVGWVGQNILGVDEPLAFAVGGNSDGIFGFVQLFCFVALALIAALVWTLLDRRTAYPRLSSLLRVVVRYSLALSMLSYGMVKVINVQFPFPGLQDLLVPLGDTRPFMVLGHFMGTSAAYTFFTGAGEVLAAGLLLFRRTTTLGALVTFAIMLNVAMLNFSYDWPEKLDAVHLLILAAFLLSADAVRLANLLVLNRPAMPASLGERRSAPAMTVKAVVIAHMLVTTPLIAVNLRGLDAPPSPLYGIYTVEEFTRNGMLIQPLASDSTRWKTIVLDAADAVSLRTMNDTWRRYRAEYVAETKRLRIFLGRGAAAPSEFVSSRPTRDELVLQGVFRADTLVVKLKRVDESSLVLLRSRFRWINGQP